MGDDNEYIQLEGAPVEWDESFFERCRIVRNGWGQGGPAGSTQEVSRPPVSKGQSGNTSYEGPVTSWPTYRAITAKDWELYKDHGIVFSDGSNIVGIEPGWLVCGLCNNKKAVTKDLMQMHIESTKHKRNYDWAKMAAAREVADVSPVNEPARLAPVRSVSSNPVKLGPGEFSEKEQQILDTNFCELGADGWIICTICEKKCMNMDFVASHIESTRHKNRMGWTPAVQAASMVSEDLPPGIILTKDGFYCTYCGAAEMSNTQVVQLHVQGQRHQQHLVGGNASSVNSVFNGETEALAQVPPREGVLFKHLISNAEEGDSWATKENEPQQPPARKESISVTQGTHQDDSPEEIIDL